MRFNPIVKIPLYLFIFATIVSWVYCTVTNQFNGDFWTRENTLSQTLLFIIFLISIIPYFFLYRFDIYFKARASRKKKLILPAWFLEFFLLLIFGWSIGVTLIFDVGVMSQQFYDAPSWIKPIIQLGNRIDPTFVGAFYILSAPKRFISDAKPAFLMITLGLLRSGLGVFLYLFIIFTVKYHRELIQFIKHRFLILLIALTFSANIIGILFDIRSTLRNEIQVSLEFSDLMAAKLAGRISSYSNFAYLIQESDEFSNAARDLSSMYYSGQIAGRLIHGDLSPNVTPEKILIDSSFLYDGYSTFMPSVPGNFLLAWFVSPWVAFANLLILIIIVLSTLKISHTFGNGSASSVGIVMLLYPLTSGVSHELAFVLFNALIFYLFCKIFGRKVHVPPAISEKIRSFSY